MFSFVKEDCVFITPNKRKKELISAFSNNLNCSIKYYSKSELINLLSCSYTDQTIVYLMNKGYSYSNTIEILDNIGFVKKGTNKLNLLVDLKEELEDDYLLTYNKLGKYHFVNKKVYVYGYSKKDKELVSLLDSLSVNYSFIEEENKKYSHEVYEFNDIEEEVLFFFEKVNNLVEEGVQLDDICLYSYPSEYDMILRKYASYFSLPINFPSRLTLVEIPLFKEFIEYSKEKEIEESFELVKEKKDRYNAINKLLNLVNDVMDLEISKERKIDLIVNKAKYVALSESKYKHGINIVDDTYRGDKYVFVLGFSLGSYPVIKKDTDFLLDKEKEICGLNVSFVENEIRNESLELFLNNNKNLIISLKKKIGDKVYYDSLLLNELGYKKVNHIRSEVRYSEKLLELEVASYQDLKNDYGISSKYLYGKEPSSFRYKEYDHHYVNQDIVKDSNIKLSYTSLNDFIRCPFKYYIQNICRINEFEKTFEMRLGTFFHDILETSLKREIVKEEWDERKEKDFLTVKEKFFVDKLFYQVLEVIEKNKAFNLITSFKSEYGEQELEYWIDKHSKLYGKVDRILVNEEDKEIIVVDYKTGSASFQEERVPFGLSLQLPIYCLLIKKVYPEYTPVGIFIQNVLDKKENVDKKYKLSGIIVNEEGKLEHIEHSLSNYSKYVAGLRYTSKGYQETKSLVTQERFDELLDITEDIISSSIHKMRNGEFPISPITINDKDEACKYCSLKNICFVKEEDRRYLYIEEDEEEDD